MASSTYKISVVIWNLGLFCGKIWMVSSSFYVLLSSAFVARGIDSIPLSCLCTACILSKTFLISVNSFCILPLWFSASSNLSDARSFTLSTTRLVSSSVIMYSGNCLWALAFLRDPLVCINGHLGGPTSCGVVVDEVFYFVVSPLPCSS
jgi:hypothetical protein